MKFWILPMTLALLFSACGSEKDRSEKPAEPQTSDGVIVWPKLPWPFPTPSPKPVPVPAPSPTPSPVPPSGSRWEKLHNDLRLRHGVAPVKETQVLVAEAQAWANRCVFQHAQGTGHGENLAIGTGLTAERTMELWYAEGKGYPYGVATPAMSYMHFTQVVWKGTTEIGCASRLCSQGTLYVCRYNPPGNYIGQFNQNVLRPIS